MTTTEKLRQIQRLMEDLALKKLGKTRNDLWDAFMSGVSLLGISFQIHPTVTTPNQIIGVSITETETSLEFGGYGDTFEDAIEHLYEQLMEEVS